MGKVYGRLHNWLFPIDKYERDIITVPPHDYFHSTPFQKLIKEHLAWNAIDRSKRVYPTRVEIQENRALLRKCGFSDGKYIEKLIVSEFLEMKRNIPDLNSVNFAHFFEEHYHNVKLVKFAILEAQKSNEITKECYDSIKGFLIEIQGYLEVFDLRTRIECDFVDTGNWNNCSRVEEFVTPFAKVSLICNKSAKFSINYFINPHLKELVGESLGDTLEKRFDELANGEMKDFIKMVPLERRYDRYFEELLRFSQTNLNYKAVITDKNSL